MNLKIFCLPLISLLFVIAVGKPVVKSIDPVSLKGYWIRKAGKIDIENIKLNNENKLQGKSYSTAVDYKQELFFIPLDSITSKRNLASILNTKNNYYDKQVFFKPSEETELYIKKFCGIEQPIKSSPALYDENTYYELRDAANQTNSYLYNVTYVEGEAFQCQVENSPSNKRYLSLSYRVDPNLSKFDCFFIFKVNKLDYNPMLHQQGLLSYHFQSNNIKVKE